MNPQVYIEHRHPDTLDPDTRVLEAVRDQLDAHGQFDIVAIEITVTNGAVTLAGPVPSDDLKRTAEDLAYTVSTPGTVHNQLAVQAA